MIVKLSNAKVVTFEYEQTVLANFTNSQFEKVPHLTHHETNAKLWRFSYFSMFTPFLFSNLGKFVNFSLLFYNRMFGCQQ